LAHDQAVFSFSAYCNSLVPKELVGPSGRF
jgi:hypothetical protein